MTAVEIWESHPEFQKYDKTKFKTYNKNMIALTNKRKSMIRSEEEGFTRDMIKLPKNNKTNRGIPFWHCHPASKLLKDHVKCEMNGSAKKIPPHKLWESRVEYQDFPSCVFANIFIKRGRNSSLLLTGKINATKMRRKNMKRRRQ